MTRRQAKVAPAGPARAGQPRPADLEHLLGRVASGDKAAFALVYDQLAGTVYGLARTLAGDAGWSQELAAAALTEVWRAAPRYDPDEASAQSWVMRVARQHIVSQVRAVRAGRGRRDLDRPSVPASDCGAEHQTVLLALYGGFTKDEIGNRLGLTPETVAGLIRDGLRPSRSA